MEEGRTNPLREGCDEVQDEEDDRRRLREGDALVFCVVVAGLRREKSGQASVSRGCESGKTDLSSCSTNAEKDEEERGEVSRHMVNVEVEKGGDDKRGGCW